MIGNVGNIGFLWQLQNLDLEQLNLYRKLQNMEVLQLINKLELELAKEQTTLVQIVQKVEDTNKRLKRREMELATKKEQKKQLQDRLYSGQVTNAKELSQIQQKLGHLEEQETVLEEEILRLMFTQEELEKEHELINLSIGKIEDELKDNNQSYMLQVEEIKMKLEEIQPLKEELHAKVDHKILQLYRELKSKKGGRAVAAVRGDLCLGCRISIPVNLVSQIIRNNRLQTCPNCGRILYYEGTK
ncbi:MAG: zinc ribbon domain-containing protein [bacterium]|jgi:predicted  nucleic acid-binding Zn-ribbon protein